MRGHEINCLHGPQGDHVVISPPVPHDANGADRQKHREGLARLVVQVVFAQLADEDVVGVAQQVGELFLDLAEDPHTQARTGERVPVDHLARQSELNAQAPHFILEQLAQGLNEFELHLLRQAADVVMRLDDVRFASASPRRLDYVWVDRTLRKESNAGQLVGFFVESLDECAPDDLALLLRVSDSGQRSEKALFGIDADDAYAEVLGKRTHHLVTLAEAQQTMIDEYTDELITDRAMEERSDY